MVRTERADARKVRTQQADELIHARNGMAKFVPSRIDQAGHHDLPVSMGVMAQ